MVVDLECDLVTSDPVYGMCSVGCVCVGCVCVYCGGVMCSQITALEGQGIHTVVCTDRTTRSLWTAKVRGWSGDDAA